MSRIYKAEDVEPILQDLYDQVANALAVAEDATKSASEKDAVIADLRAQIAVRLEKVASEQRPSLDAALVDSTLETLEDLAVLKPGGREKIASELIEDPNNALRLLERIVTLSAEAPQSGQGIPKTASASNTTAPGEDPDGWGNVVRHGA